MNPLELVTKTLYSFEEKELTTQVLQAFGKRAETFEQHNDVAKIFFEIKDFSNAILYGEKALKLTKSKEELYITTKNLINAYRRLKERHITTYQDIISVKMIFIQDFNISSKQEKLRHIKIENFQSLKSGMEL